MAKYKASPTLMGMRRALESGQLNGIFVVGFDINRDLYKELSKYEDQLDEAAFKKKLTQFTNFAGREIANAAADKMYEWLKPGGDKDIGHTGQSANSLFVGKMERGTAQVWYVYEGGNDIAGNLAIRLGVKPKPSDSRAARSHSVSAWNKKADAMSGSKKVRAAAIYRSKNPYFAAIEVWAKKKGLTPKQDQEDIDEDEYVSSGRPFPKKKTKKDKRLEWRGMLWALWHTWKTKGQSVNYQDVFGAPYFDYPAEYARSSSAETIADKVMKGRPLGGKTPEYSVERITAAFVRSSLYKRMGVVQRVGAGTLVAQE